MRSGLTTVGGLLLVAALAAAGPIPAVSAETAAGADKPAGAGKADGRTRTVTLVTGDRVTVTDGGAGSVVVERGPGRAGVAFLHQRVEGHLRVIPTDAVALVRAGKLDPRLFDVTTLLEYGYDERADLPLMITASKRDAAAVSTAATTLNKAGAKVTRKLPRAGVVAAKQDRARAATVWRALTGGPGRKSAALGPAVSTIWLDGVRRPALDASVPQVGAPTAWQAGYTGAGVKVAVLDTGIDDSHPDLAGRVAARGNFTEGMEDGRDTRGHGTHVASTVAGGGAASGGKYRGAAPDSQLLDGKVCVARGCAESWILAGMEWAVSQGARVVNMSLGGTDDPGIDPLEQAVNSFTAEHGTLFVVSAGNSGPSDSSIGSPASADAALAVGAVDKSDQIAVFSSRGPRVGDGGLKPDITAPGVAITAARSGDAVALPSDGGDSYVAFSGTSMAAPHVAGAAAILAQQHPDWTAGRLKSALMNSAEPHPALDVYAQGSGRLDVAKGITQSVTSEPASLNFGGQSWPHGDDTPIDRVVTYHNDAAEPVTLHLRSTATGPGGAAVPAGLFALSAETLTVPAHGNAQVTITADTRVASPDGRWTGRLTAATAAGNEVGRTSFVVEKEVESYELTLRHIDRDGNLTPFYGTDLEGVDKTESYSPYDPSGTVTIRVPRGRYALTSSSYVLDETKPFTFTLLAQPVLDVTRDTDVTLDYRLGKPNKLTVPRAGATNIDAGIFFRMPTASGTWGGGIRGLPSLDVLYTAQLGGTEPVAGFTSSIEGRWAQVNSDGEPVNSPYTYSIRYDEAGRLISGYQRAVSEKELAEVRTTYHGGNDPSMIAGWDAINRGPGESGIAIFTPLRYSIPSTASHYVNKSDGVEWNSEVRHAVFDPVYEAWETYGLLSRGWTRYEPGRVYSESWGRAAAGPLLPTRDDPWWGAVRQGDSIIVDLPLYGDGDGHPGDGVASGGTELYRDGTKIGETAWPGVGQFTAPAGEGVYQLKVHSERDTPFRLSTRTDVTWSFRSGHVDGDRPVALPLWSVRFSPPVDGHNVATAGRPVAVPVTVVPHPGASAGRLRTATVHASYDDGVTWTPVEMSGGDDWTALLKHPAGEGFVSLRATATDSQGNSVDQTIIRAYQYGPAA